MKIPKVLVLIDLLFCCCLLQGQDTINKVKPIFVNDKIGILLPIISSSSNQLYIRKKGIDIPIWGQFENHQSELIFYPRVPLSELFVYEIVDKKSKKIIGQFAMTIPKNNQTPFVNTIHPQDSLLPQNLLRFHIVFSRTMRKGQFEKKIKLVDRTTGLVLENVFEKMRHEIWNEDGTRLTLYLDPGRIKSGLGLRKKLGMPLIEGHQYQLQVAASWKDIYGKSLQEEYHKNFLVKEIDKEKPCEQHVKVTYENGKIKLAFNEPINHPQIEQAIFVKKKEQIIKGKWHSNDGQFYSFTAHNFLGKGAYELIISSELEDLVGHSFRRSFESIVGTEYKSPYWIQKLVQVN